MGALRERDYHLVPKQDGAPVLSVLRQNLYWTTVYG